MAADTKVKLGLAALTVVAGLCSASSARATTFVWQGDGADATGPGVPAPDADEVTAGELPFKDWNDGANWANGTVPTINDDINFAVPTVTGAMNVAFNAPVFAKSIFVTQQTAPLHYEVQAYGAGKLTLAAGGSITFDNNTPGIPFTTPIDLNGSASIIGGATASSFSFQNSPITGLASGSTLTLTPNSGTASAVGVISGPINVVRTGAGALTFLGASTYTGSTSIAGGTTIARVNNALPATTVLTLGNGATAGVLRLDSNSNITLAGIINGGSATTNGINGNATTGARSIITINASQYSTFNGRFGATSPQSQYLDFVKAGPANFTLSGTSHPLTGSVSVTGGTLEIEGAGNFSNASGIIVNGGRLMWGSSATLARPVTLAAGTIGGTGNINAPVSVGANATISPGGNVDSAGVLTETIAAQNYQSGLTLAPSGTMHDDVDATTGDRMAVSGGSGLSITATSSAKFAVDLSTSGLTPGAAYTRTIATSSAAIIGFSADKFAVIGAGAGAVALQDPNTLVVNFNAAQSIYWDNNGTAAGGGGAAPSGAWDGSTPIFNTDATGGAGGATTGATLAYHNVSFAAASDGGGTYAVNVSGTQSALSIDIARGDVSLTGGTIATGAFNVASGSTATVSSNLTGGPTGALVKTGPGTLTLTANNAYTGGTTVAGGTLRVTKMQANNAVSIAGGAKLQVIDSSPTFPSHPSGEDAFVSQPSKLTIASGGTLDLGNNDMIIRYGAGTPYNGTSPLAALEALVTRGFGVNQDWTGTGITSSTAASEDAAGNFVIAIADNALLPQAFGVSNGGENFDGVDVPLESVLIKFTHRVDLNLDGLVNGDDAQIFSTNYDNGSPAYWSIGDLDYNGVFNSDDVQLFATYYDNTLQHLPEPGIAGIGVGLLAAGLAKRSRKHD